MPSNTNNQAAQPVENSSRCRHCGDPIEYKWMAWRTIPDAGAYCKKVDGHHEPISGGASMPLYSEQEMKELGLQASTINYGAEGSATMYSDAPKSGASTGEQPPPVEAVVTVANGAPTDRLNVCMYCQKSIQFKDGYWRALEENTRYCKEHDGRHSSEAAHPSEPSATKVEPPQVEEIAYLVEVITAARDVIATLQKELGRVPGGYSTTMTENERLAAKSVANLDEILRKHLLGAPTQPGPEEKPE